MNIKKIEMYNFLSYKKATLNLEEDGIYNIVGKNGAGKSSIRDAITYCLFGKTRAEDQEELIHNGEDNMSVSVTLEHNRKTFIITRQKNRKESTKLMVEEVKNEI